MDNTARTMEDMQNNGMANMPSGQFDTAVLEDPESSWFFSTPEEFDVSKLSDDGRHSHMSLIDTFASAFDESTVDKFSTGDSAEKPFGLAGDNGVLISGGVPTADAAPVSYFDPAARTEASNGVIDNSPMSSMTSAAPVSVEPDAGVGTGMPDFNVPSFDHDEISFSGLIDEQGQPTVDLQSVLKRSVLGGYSKASVHDLIDEISNSDAQLRAGLERQIQDLSREVASSTSECKLLRSQMEQIEERRAKLEASLSDTSAQLDAARDQSEDKVEQLAAVRSQLEQAMDMKEKLEQGIAELEAHKHDAVAQINQLKDELNRVSNELDRVSNELNRVSEERDSALSRLEAMSTNVDDNAALLKDAQSKNSELEQQIEALTSELSAAQEQVAGHAELIDKVEQTVRECNELSDHIDELSQVNADLMTQNNELAGLCQDFEAERDTLLSRATAAENVAACAQDEVATARQVAARAQDEAAAARQLAARAQDEATAARQLAARAQDEATAAQAEATRAQEEAVASQERAAEYEAAHRAIHHRCNELTATLDAAKQRYETLLVEMSKTRADNEKLTKALGEAQSMNNRLSAAFAKSYKVISALMGEFDAVCAYADHAVSNTADTVSVPENDYAVAPSSDSTIVDGAPKHFCDGDDVPAQIEAEHADTPSFTLVNEKNVEPVTHKLSAEEYLRQRNPQH
ncbi:coiled-coil domain-containing protein [Atopobium fossor]|uniref:hypothetical protein n=1 Tax=Atopobium fossor TaxID=39487 RepID=UPI0004270D8F|nr:hypothetical protein [Atopobium fossor]